MHMFEKQGERNRGGREGGREREGERVREKDAKNQSYNILLRNFMYYHIQYINSSTTNYHGYIVLHYVCKK